ncbi:thermonuclease family protein [Omnitrophica bacterium]|nr:thermonuclease family protein [Candidatus Omnitrophota bacterium]
MAGRPYPAKFLRTFVPLIYFLSLPAAQSGMAFAQPQPSAEEIIQNHKISTSSPAVPVDSLTSKSVPRLTTDSLETNQPTPLMPVSPSRQTHTVARAVDGDTLVLSNGERVRLIGVDTPETKHPLKPVEYFGKEASAFTKREIEGREVRLEYDWEKTDKYGRTLAYVYRASDDFFINAEIIKQGYGHAYTRFPFKHMEEFSEYERLAREGEVGLWKMKQ